MLPPNADRPKLSMVLEQLDATVEQLLLGGLTTAGESTRRTLGVAMQEAARFRLLRLGSSLRVAMEELGRFQAQEETFSRRRLSFFLNRSWLLSRGIAHALQSEDEADYDRLSWTAPSVPLAEVEVACLGVLKKVARGAFVAFEFRLRATSEAGPIAPGTRLSWSLIFPRKPGVAIPAEGYLHLPQKQKFKPALMLDGKTITFRDATVALDDDGGGRIGLTDVGSVVAGEPFRAWGRFLEWSPAHALQRIKKKAPGPLDLDTELQEDVVLRDYEIEGPVAGNEPGQSAFPITAGRLELHAVASDGEEGEALKSKLNALRKLKKNRPPLYGLMHYESCRLVFQPLSTFGPSGPDYLPISQKNIDKAALLKAMSFA